MTVPVRRRPGRPRKHPLPEETVPEAPETPEAPTGESEAVVERGTPPLADSRDPRVGLECHPTASHVGFDDGSLYLAEGGYVVKRVS